MGDEHLDEKAMITLLDNYIRHDRVEMMFEDGTIEAMDLFAMGHQFLIANLRPDLGQQQFSSFIEDLLCQLMQRTFQSLLALCRSIVAEMMFLEGAFSGDEPCPAARTDAVTLQT